MKTLQTNGRTTTLELSAAELMIINNALNAVSHVVSIADFHPLIGAWPEEVQSLLSEIGRALNYMGEGQDAES